MDEVWLARERVRGIEKTSMRRIRAGRSWVGHSAMAQTLVAIKITTMARAIAPRQ